MEINKLTFETLRNLGISQNFEDLDVNNDGVINEKDKTATDNAEIKKAINNVLNSVDDEDAIQLVDDDFNMFEKASASGAKVKVKDNSNTKAAENLLEKISWPLKNGESIGTITQENGRITSFRIAQEPHNTQVDKFDITYDKNGNIINIRHTEDYSEASSGKTEDGAIISAARSVGGSILEYEDFQFKNGQYTGKIVAESGLNYAYSTGAPYSGNYLKAFDTKGNILYSIDLVLKSSEDFKEFSNVSLNSTTINFASGKSIKINSGDFLYYEDGKIKVERTKQNKVEFYDNTGKLLKSENAPKKEIGTVDYIKKLLNIKSFDFEIKTTTDEQGRVVSITNANDNIAGGTNYRITYLPKNEVSITISNPGLPGAGITTNTYNSAGKITKSESENGSLNPAGECHWISIYNDDGSYVTTAYNGNGDVLNTKEYDKDGNIKSQRKRYNPEEKVGKTTTSATDLKYYKNGKFFVNTVVQAKGTTNIQSDYTDKSIVSSMTKNDDGTYTRINANGALETFQPTAKLSISKLVAELQHNYEIMLYEKISRLESEDYENKDTMKIETDWNQYKTNYEIIMSAFYSADMKGKREITATEYYKILASCNEKTPDYVQNSFENIKQNKNGTYTKTYADGSSETLTGDKTFSISSLVTEFNMNYSIALTNKTINTGLLDLDNDDELYAEWESFKLKYDTISKVFQELDKNGILNISVSQYYKIVEYINCGSSMSESAITAFVQSIIKE